MRDTIAGRFELLTPIAEGGSGAVWRAHDLRLGRVCAAKVLRQRDSADLLRFVREQSVNLEHPHVVAPYGWAAEDEHVAIAMELVSGGTLEAALQDNGAVADWLAEELVCQLLEALRFVHARGWVHRDVKPANVLLEPTGTATPVARLADFGIAVRLHDARLTHTGTVVGTPGYLPHEAYAPGNPSRAMDLYAAGVTAVRTVLPEADLSGDPLGPEDVAGLALFENSPVLQDGVRGLLSADPEERIDAADRLLDQLLAGAQRSAETADGEPFEVFDVLEPTTERELSPVADAARLPPGEDRGQDAPVAWHAVHRQAIRHSVRTALVERGADPLRPFGPVSDGGAGEGGSDRAPSAVSADNPRGTGVEHSGRGRGPEQLGDQHGPPAPAAVHDLVTADSTERLDPSVPSALTAPSAGAPAADPAPEVSRRVDEGAVAQTSGTEPVPVVDPVRHTTPRLRTGSEEETAGLTAPRLLHPGQGSEDVSAAPVPSGARGVSERADALSGTGERTARMPAARAVPRGDPRPPEDRVRQRGARWPWWFAAVALATLALVAGYVWLGPLLAGWTGDPQPGGIQTPAPSAPATTSVPTVDPTPTPAQATPVCTELEDGTVSCIVTP